MKDMHQGLIGIFEFEGLLEEKQTSIHFNEWWSGEGMDFDISCGSESRKISLSIDELHAIAAIAHATNYLEIEQVKEQSAELTSSSEARRRNVERIRAKYQRGEY